MPIKSADPRALAETSLFNGLPLAQLEELSRDVQCKTFPAATHVLSTEQPGDVVFVILSGTVKIELERPYGTPVILAVLGPGETVGEMSVARQLLTLADALGEADADGTTLIPARLTQTDLASLVGASRVRVNQALILFQRQGYIAIQPQYRIAVLNRAALAARCA